MADAIVSQMFAAARTALRQHQILPDDKEPSAELTAALYAYLKASAQAQLIREGSEAREAWNARIMRPVLLDDLDESGSLD